MLYFSIEKCWHGEWDVHSVVTSVQTSPERIPHRQGNQVHGSEIRNSSSWISTKAASSGIKVIYNFIVLFGTPQGSFTPMVHSSKRRCLTDSCLMFIKVHFYQRLLERTYYNIWFHVVVLRKNFSLPGNAIILANKFQVLFFCIMTLFWIIVLNVESDQEKDDFYTISVESIFE